MLRSPTALGALLARSQAAGPGEAALAATTAALSGLQLGSVAPAAPQLRVMTGARRPARPAGAPSLLTQRLLLDRRSGAAHQGEAISHFWPCFPAGDQLVGTNARTGPLGRGALQHQLALHAAGAAACAAAHRGDAWLPWRRLPALRTSHPPTHLQLGPPAERPRSPCHPPCHPRPRAHRPASPRSPPPAAQARSFASRALRDRYAGQPTTYVQLLQHIGRTRKLYKLEGLVSEYGARFDAVHASAALARLPKVLFAGQRTAGELSDDQRRKVSGLLERLSEQMVALRERVFARQVANSLWACAKLAQVSPGGWRARWRRRGAPAPAGRTRLAACPSGRLPWAARRV
jgi:hypothetical protein